jgi:hypothetical protein
LDKEGIETRPFTGALNRTFPYYAKADLDRIRNAKARRRPVPKYPDLVHIDEAARECGVSRMTLKEARQARLTGPHFHAAKDSQGRASLRSYLPRRFVDQFKAERRLALDPDDITVREATEILGFSRGWVKQLAYRGILKKVKKARIPWKGMHTRRGGLLLSRSEVEAYRQELARQKAGTPVEPRLTSTEPLKPVASQGIKKRGPGRPEGTTDKEVAERNRQIAEALRTKKYPTIADCARAFEVDRKIVYRVQATLLASARH